MKIKALALFAGVLLSTLTASTARAIDEDQVLLLFNSQNAESQAVRDMYLAIHPGVREFDFNDATIPTQFLTRTEFNAKIRLPLLNHVNGVAAPFDDISSDIVVILTTRGLPTLIQGGGQFAINTSYASVESELTLLQQNLDVAGNAALPFRFNGVIDNPFHLNNTVPVTNFSRANIKQPKNFTIVGPTGGEHWYITDLTPGDIYLTCRLDAQPSGIGGPNPRTALENIQLLLNRSQNLVVSKCQVQCLFDEYQPGANQLDDDDLPPRFPLRDDFDKAAQFLTNQGFAVTHDQTTNFITGTELPDNRRLLVLGSYGENHDLAPGAENPPGNGEYLSTYDFDPAAIFISYESFNAHDIAGQSGSDHAQVTDFIALGGSFTIGHAAEPFSNFVADSEYLARALYANGRTFAEAAWVATPALSITNVPIGDPLATVTVVDTFTADIDSSGEVNIDDLNEILSNWQQTVGVGHRSDVANNDGVINIDDLNIVLASWLESCP